MPLSYFVFGKNIFARVKYLLSPIANVLHYIKYLPYPITNVLSLEQANSLPLPSPVHIMIYSRHRYNEVVKSIFSVVKVRIIEGSNKRIDASFDPSPPPLSLKNRRQARCRCDQSVSLFLPYASIFIVVSLLYTNDRSRFFIDEK